MIVNQKKKIDNAVAFFASEYKRVYDRWPAQMWIYKLLALLDFRMLEETGRPCLGLDYTAMENGPVSPYLYDNRENGSMSDVFRFMPGAAHSWYYIEALKQPDLTYFSDRAVDMMKDLSDEFISSRRSLNELISATYEIPAWGRAREAAKRCGREDMAMEYGEAFPKNPALKDIGDLSWQEEMFLTYEKHRKAEMSGSE